MKLKSSTLAFLALLAFTSLSPSATTNTWRVYFIGNSVTDTVRYGELAKLAAARGVKLDWGRTMIPGAPLEWIYTHPNDGFQQEPYGRWTNALNNFAWDAVSLQPFDRQLHGKNQEGRDLGDVALMKEFAEMAARKNPEVQIYLYARWPRVTRGGKGTPFDKNDYDPTKPGSGDDLSKVDDFTARWLTSGEHPLVARVLVNRFWLHHFGRGLVNTPGDFGQLGERPAHPELLDWLAREFMDGGWQLKRMHKLMLTSAAYRQSSRNDPSLRADPENRFYARWKLQRLDAETLRDSMLATSGKLNLAQFGAPVAVARDPAGRIVAGAQKSDANGDPVGVDSVGDAEFRRSIYVQMRRTRPLTVLDTFDLPVMSPNCDARAVTTVAPQSLLLMNDAFVIAQSQHLAERLRKESSGDVRAQITRAWRLLFGTAPRDDEMRASLTFLAEQGETIRARTAAAVDNAKKEKPAPPDVPLLTLASLCQVLLSDNRFLYVD